MAATRDELALMPIDVRERSEAIPLDLVQPIGMSSVGIPVHLDVADLAVSGG